MKRILLLKIILIYTVHLFSQMYSIQNSEILLVLENDNNENECLINRLLLDTLLDTNCKSMVIDGMFKSIPPSLYDIDWIEQLQININDTIFIDNNFSKFKKLDGLLIFGGYLNIDEKIILQNLKYLQFQYVKFIDGKFPEAIFNWFNLRDIMITESNIDILPGTIIKLNKLEVLGLSYNNIKNIPNELFSLENLQNLSLYGNKLKKISPKICNMKSLKYIHLDIDLRLDSSVKNCLKARIIRFDKYGMPYEDN